MTDYPFPADTIQNHRFHGLFAGSFTIDGHQVKLQTSFGLLNLFPLEGKGGKRAVLAAKNQQLHHPESEINAYGYPRVKGGKLIGLQLASWHVVGSEGSDGPPPISRRFAPGQIFLCGLVKEISPNAGGPIKVRVKSEIPGVGQRWWDIDAFCLDAARLHSKTLFHGWVADDSRLFLKVEQEITPPGRKTRLLGASAHPQGSVGSSPSPRRSPPSSLQWIPSSRSSNSTPRPIRRQRPQSQ